MSSKSKTSTKNWILIGIVMIISFVLFLTTSIGGGEISMQVLKTKSVWLLFVYIFFVVMWLRVTKQPYSIFFFFLLYSIMTNGGQIMLYALGIEFTDNVDMFSLTIRYLIKAIDFQGLSTAFFCTFGMIANCVHDKSYKLDHKPISCAYDETTDNLYIISAVLYTAVNVLRLSSRVNMSYGDAFATGTSSGITIYFRLFFYIMLFMSLYKHKDKNDGFNKIIWILAAVVGGTSVLFGSRNTLIPMIFGIIFIVRDDIPKISRGKKILIVILAILGIMFLNAFSTIRGIPFSELSFDVVFSLLFAQGPFTQLISLIAEMGGSIRVLTYTMNYIDTGVVFSEQTLLYSLLRGIVPDLSILEFVGITEPINWRLSSWITDTQNSFSGLGYSMMAEAYYNFAENGVYFFILFGYLYEWSECLIKKLFATGHTVIASVWLYVIAYAIFMARADSLLLTTPIRYAVYVTVAALLLKNVRIVLKKK